MEDARTIVFDYFLNDYQYANNSTLYSLMDYLDTDTLVAWFVDEGYADELDGDAKKIIDHHYDLHC